MDGLTSCVAGCEFH